MKPLVKTTLLASALAGAMLIGGTAYATSAAAPSQNDQTARRQFAKDRAANSRFENQNTLVCKSETPPKQTLQEMPYDLRTPEKTQSFSFPTPKMNINPDPEVTGISTVSPRRIPIPFTDKENIQLRPNSH